jgi:hypothetical protein
LGGDRHRLEPLRVLNLRQVGSGRRIVGDEPVLDRVPEHLVRRDERMLDRARMQWSLRAQGGSFPQGENPRLNVRNTIDPMRLLPNAG